MTTIVRHSLVCATVFLTVWSGGVPSVAEDTATGEATAIVTELHDALIGIMKEGDALGYQGRVRTISPVIDRTHDLDTIARLVLGRYWKGLTETERSLFVKTFRDLSIVTYAGQFKEYGGEQFTILSEKPLPRGHRKLVVSRLVKADGEHIAFHYILHQVQRQWKILSISVNGVSDLALKRTEYGGILKQDGFPTLLQQLQDQIQDRKHER